MEENNLNISLDDEEISNEIKEEFKKTGKIHIEKTGSDGEDVKIDVDKNKKTVDVNVNDDGKKTNVKVGLSGVQVEEDGESKVNIKFWPIFLFVGLIITGVLFTIYKIVELIISAI